MMCENELVFGDENELAKKIRDFLGVGDYEKVGREIPCPDCKEGENGKV